MAKRKPKTADYDFLVYAEGPVMSSACTSLNDEDAVERMNARHPTGISSQWRIADEPFKDGTPNGCKCHDYPDTHRHLLFNC